MFTCLLVTHYPHRSNLFQYLLFQEKQEREEEERKKRLQLYVFILRCISYPFNAKQPTDMTKRQIKVTKHQLDVIQGRFQVRYVPVDVRFSILGLFVMLFFSVCLLP